MVKHAILRKSKDGAVDRVRPFMQTRPRLEYTL